MTKLLFLTFSEYLDLCEKSKHNKPSDHHTTAHLIARYMGRMANRGKVWTFIMMVMKAMYRSTLMKPGIKTSANI